VPKRIFGVHAYDVGRHHVGGAFRTPAVIAAIAGPSLSMRIAVAISSAATRPVVHFSPTFGFVVAEPR
jgi:hypothetical protein